MKGRAAVTFAISVGLILAGAHLVGFAYPRLHRAQALTRRLGACATRALILDDSASRLSQRQRTAERYNPLVRELDALADSCSAMQNSTGTGIVSPAQWASLSTNGTLQYGDSVRPLRPRSRQLVRAAERPAPLPSPGDTGAITGPRCLPSDTTAAC